MASLASTEVEERDKGRGGLRLTAEKNEIGTKETGFQRWLRVRLGECPSVQIRAIRGRLSAIAEDLDFNADSRIVQHSIR